MLNIIILLIAGSALAYISQYNLELVKLDFGIYSFSNIPLFYVIVGSLLVGIVLSYLLQLLGNIFTFLEMRGKSKEIKIGKEEILSLTKTVHHLELENEKLKHSEPIEFDSKSI